MTLLYAKEHTTCYNYDKSPSPIIQKSTFSQGDTWEFTSIKNKLIYISEGEYLFSYGKYNDKLITKGQLALIPAGSRVTGTIKSSTTIFILRLRETKNLCECFSLDMLMHETDESSGHNELFFLDASNKITSFFRLFDELISDGLKCRYFLLLKIKELFYLLRAYHTKEDLLQFFYPLLSNDMTFSDFVLRNHFKVKTVNELADLANYSLSGFQKRFKKVFGVSAYTWMKEQKLKTIFHDITSTTKSFKELSDEYAFSSPSHFNDFCKANFGYTPGILRKKKLSVRLLKE